MDNAEDWVLHGSDLRSYSRVNPWCRTRPSLPAAISSEGRHVT